MTDLVRIQILRLYRAFHAGEVAGFPPAEAAMLIRAGIGRRDEAAAGQGADGLPTDAFDGLSRAALITYGRDRLGLDEDPPNDATDDELRAALRALAAEHRDADFQDGPNRLDHPAQSAQVDGAVTLRGIGSPNPVPRRSTARRLPPASSAGDQLDAMDRPHLEALARTKLGLDAVDPDLTDDELRGQIRALADAAQA